METQTFKVLIEKVSVKDDSVAFDIKYENKTQPNNEAVKVKYKFKHLNDIKRVNDTIKNELIRITDLHNNIDEIRHTYENKMITYDINIVITDVDNFVEDEEVPVVTEKIGFFDKVKNILKI